MSSELFEVEWTSDCPEDECGDLSLDEAVTHQKYFKDKRSAIGFAKRVLPDDFFGAVKLTPCHLEPYEPGLPGSFVEYDGDPEFVE